MIGATALLAVSTLAVPAGAANDAPFVAALIIGLNTSRDPGVAALRYADDDAARYWELFQAIGDRTELLSVLDPETQAAHPAAAAAARPPTRAELAESVGRLAREVREIRDKGGRAELFFIYAGHGSVGGDGEGYVNLLDGTLRRRDLFRSVLDPIPASYKHVIVDACNAYFLVARRGAASAEEMKAVRNFLDTEALEGHPEVGVLVSGTREVATHEWSALASGVFSHEVRSALLGAADADGDGLVRYGEVAAFVSAANEGLADPRARVEVFARPPALDLAHPLVDLRRGKKRFLEVPTLFSGHCRIEDGRGERYADFNASGESPVIVKLLGSGAYYVYRGEREAVVRAAEEGLAVLTKDSFGPIRSAPRGPVEDDLRRGLFSVPYGPSFMRGFVAHESSFGALVPPVGVFPDATIPALEVERPPGMSPLRRAAWVAVGAGVLLGAGSAVSALEARSGYDDFVQRLASQGTYNPREVQQVENWRLATNLMLAGAIVCGAGGVALLFLSDPHGTTVALGPGPAMHIRVRF